jgi:uncharacterized DUF497 family protein
MAAGGSGRWTSIPPYGFLYCQMLVFAYSQTEERFYCFGEVDGGVLTVRFTYRASVIRIIGAGYWRKGKAIYERENKIHG